MEDNTNNEPNIKKKRARVDSDSDSGSTTENRESKRVAFDSIIGSTESRVDSLSDSFISRVDSVASESFVVSNEFLDILDDTDTVPEMQDLDSVIRSFEEEIFQLPPAPTFSDESQPDLGFLLEASDDELGLPPANSSTDNNLQKNEYPTSYDSFELENSVTNYDSFGFEEQYEVMNEFVRVGGLFEYPEAPDFSEFLWRPETESLPAV